jgi:hypothetical protein
LPTAHRTDGAPSPCDVTLQAKEVIMSTLGIMGRSGRRLTRTGALAVEVFARLGLGEAAPLALRRASLGERARQLSWIAENLAALHGVEVVVHGRRPSGPALLVAEPDSYLETMAVLTQVPAVVIADRALGAWPILPSAGRALGVIVEPAGGRQARAAHRLSTDALAQGVSVLALLGDSFEPAPIALAGPVPIVAVVVRTELGRDAGLVPRYLRVAGRSRTRIDVAFGAPLSARALQPPRVRRGAIALAS